MIKTHTVRTSMSFMQVGSIQAAVAAGSITAAVAAVIPDMLAKYGPSLTIVQTRALNLEEDTLNTKFVVLYYNTHCTHNAKWCVCFIFSHVF